MSHETMNNRMEHLATGNGCKAVRLLAWSCVAAWLVGCAGLPSSAYTPAVMTPLPAEHITHCLGRYLIDLPKGFELQTGGWGNIELYYGLDKNFKRVYASVKNERHTPEHFINATRARHDELQNTINDETKKPMLLNVERVGELAVMFRRHSTPNYDLSIKSQVHQLVGQRYVIFEQESFAPEKLRFTDTPNRYTYIDTAPAEERLKMISKRLRPYTDALRAPAGFCQQDVVFDVGQDDEVSTFRFFDESRPDVRLYVDYHAVTGQSAESLFERSDMTGEPALRALFPQGGGATLRKRETILGGMQAQEVLWKLSRPTVGHIFTLETRTAKQSMQQPSLAMRLKTGDTVGVQEVDQTSSSLSDAKALQLWDQGAASIRPRERLIGTGELRCRPGEVCPMSGLWAVSVAAHMPSGEHWTYQGKDLGRTQVTQGRAMPAFPGGRKDSGGWEWVWPG